MQNDSGLIEATALTAIGPVDVHTSGVSWGAVFAGAAAAAALSLILLILGFGLGLSAVSPWSYNVTAIGFSTIAWIAFTQLAAAGTGGYLAGRLRLRWPSIHTDEVYFRDTAHGLLTWSVSSLFSVALLAGAVRVVLGGALDVGTSTAAAVAPATISMSNSEDSTRANPIDYFSDMLLRSDSTKNTPDINNEAVRNGVARIFMHDLAAGQMAVEDRDYLAGLISHRTNLSRNDAAIKVDSIYSRLNAKVAVAKESAKQAADTARKAAAHSALWMFVALLFGAFVASLAATLGGRQRDKVQLRIL